MITTKILGNLRDYPCSKEIVAIPFEWFELDKRRLLKAADDGNEIGIQVDTALSNGDVLFDGEKIYAVQLKFTKLICISVTSMQEMGRVCFELGNRHLSLQIKENSVHVPYDEPTYTYLQHLGFHVEIVKDLFSDYIVCKAHGASSSHEHSHSH